MTNHTLQKKMFQTGTFLAGLAVAFGSLGAHQLKDLIDPASMAIFEKAVRYQFMHAVAMVVLAGILRKLHEQTAKQAWQLFTAGTIVFCGSLYLLSTRSVIMGDGIQWVGGIAPLGGLCFITGWGLLFYKGIKAADHNVENSRAKKLYAKRPVNENTGE